MLSDLCPSLYSWELTEPIALYPGLLSSCAPCSRTKAEKFLSRVSCQVNTLLPRNSLGRRVSGRRLETFVFLSSYKTTRPVAEYQVYVDCKRLLNTSSYASDAVLPATLVL